MSHAARLRALEDENWRIKKLLAEPILDVLALKDLMGEGPPVYADLGTLKIGNSSVMRAPSPGALSINISPPIRRARFKAIVRPCPFSVSIFSSHSQLSKIWR